MKRSILAVAALLLCIAAIPAFAVTRTVLVVDDVIKMTKAGVGDDEIIAFVKKSAAPFEITGDDVIALTEANVSKPVVKFLIDESAARIRADRQEPAVVREVVREPASTVYVGAYVDPWYYGWGWGYPYYGYPSWSIGIGWYGGGYYGGGHYPHYGYGGRPGGGHPGGGHPGGRPPSGGGGHGRH